MAGVGFVKISNLNSDLGVLLGTVARRAILAENIDSKVNEMRNREKTIILEETDETLKKSIADMDKLHGDLKKFLDEYYLLAADAGKKILKTYGPLFKNGFLLQMKLNL